MTFRHLELSSAISAITSSKKHLHMTKQSMTFVDALCLVDRTSTHYCENEAEAYGNALQFAYSHNEGGTEELSPPCPDLIAVASRRSSLVRASYEVIAEATDYETLAKAALDNGGLDDVLRGGVNENATWCLRLRQYGSSFIEDGNDMKTNKKSRSRYGKNVRSPLTAERNAIQSMAALFLRFGGNVDLKDPDCKVYLFEGFHNRGIVLARLLARGPETSKLAPKTRICITNTPLCPIAAYSMCNIAQIHETQTVLDPYAGSCATLLAASSVAPLCRTVGIEINDNDTVNRSDIQRDFESRGLPHPLGLICGDSMTAGVRDEARALIKGNAFDVIVTDPPYGIRERVSSSSDIPTSSKGDRETIRGNDFTPLEQLLMAIADDRQRGCRLLALGGRLVVFVPVSSSQTLEDAMPTKILITSAGLEVANVREQFLNDSLSRYLVSFCCVS